MSPLALLHRWRHRHGYGLHSPWVYALVREALCETAAYYAFRSLHGTAADEQLFRLALWLKADTLMAEGLSTSARQHILAAMPHIQLHSFREESIRDSSCVIVEDIRRAGKDLWQSILAHPRRTAAFDIRLPRTHRGIAFFSPQRHRQLYTL